MPDKREVARSLEEIGRLLQIEEKNRFKSIAYINAARKIDTVRMPMVQFVESGEIYRTPGIGKATGKVIEEIVRSGRSTYLEELRARYPSGIFELLRVPSLGLRKIGMLHQELGIANLDDLERAVQENRLLKLRGFGARTQQKIAEGIVMARSRRTQSLLPNGLRVAEGVVEEIRALDGVISIEVVGSVRRRLEIISNLNLSVVTKEVEKTAERIRDAGVVGEYQRVDERTIRGESRTAMDILIHLCEPDEFPTSLLFLTGTPAFVDALVAHAEKKGFALAADGVKKSGKGIPVKTEEDVFRAVGASFIPPELREEAPSSFRASKVRLVDIEDIRGAFHVHSTFSDGRATIYEMLDASAERGYSYVGLSDHSPTAFYARGLTVERLIEQHEEIEKNRHSFESLRIFKGTESDILQDGSLDYPDEILSKLDFVVASIHSRFQTPPDEMTRRIVRAIENPFTTILGHLTGRLLLSRTGYTMDFDAVFEAAADNGVFIEINGNPHRLDLDWRRMRRALELGVRFSINPDAHSIAEMNHMITGVWAARKGRVPAEHIFNTWPLERVEEHLLRRRDRAIQLTMNDER